MPLPFWAFSLAKRFSLCTNFTCHKGQSTLLKTQRQTTQDVMLLKISNK